jgi:hypothetical protein
MAIGKLVSYLGIAIIVSVFIAGFIAYFTFRVDPHTGITYDGFGRQLCKSPWIVKLVLQEGHWAGWIWFVVDLVIFWSCIAFGVILARCGFKSESKRQENQ